MKPRHLLTLALAALLGACASPAPPSHTPQTLRVDTRPGVGTHWGESRRSVVKTAYFIRANPKRPAAMAALFYNDSDGAAAMLDFLGAPRERLTGLQRLGPVELGLRTADGRWLESWRCASRWIAICEPGSRYEIALVNRSDARIEAVVSVDGMDVLDHEPATLTKRGYAVEPGETLIIDGFRTNRNTVAAFRFGPMTGTAAQGLGRDVAHVGVIGAAVFVEKKPRVPADAIRPEHAVMKAVAY